MKKEQNKFEIIFTVGILLLTIATIGVILYEPVSPIKNASNTIKLFFVIGLGLALGFMIDLFRKLKGISKDVGDSIKFLESINSNNIEHEFTSIANHFKNSRLKDKWDEFNKTIRRIEVGENEEGEIKQKYFTTVEANYFFDEDLVLNKINSKLHNYIPQLLTAIGIFGTFLGLVVGLQQLDLSNVQNTKHSISLLIAGIKVSFKSSLYGILYSMILTFYQKYCVGNLENRINCLSSKLDKLFEKNTQQDGIKEIYLQLERQTSSLQKLATDFGEEVGKKFNVSLQENLTPTLVKLGEATEKLAGMSQSTNETAIRALFENVNEMFSNVANNEMDNLKNSLHEITNKNEVMFEKFSTSIKSVETLMENQRLIISQTNSSVGNVEKTNQKIEIVTAELENVLSKLGQFSKTQHTSNEDSRVLLGEIKEHIDYQKSASEMMASMLKENLSSIQMQQKIYEDLGKTSNNLNEFNEKFKPLLENIMSNMENFRGVSDSINNKFVNTINSLENYYKLINSSVEGTFENLDKSVGSLKNDVIKNLGEINSAFLGITKKLDRFSEESSKMTDKFKEFTDTQNISQQLWKSYKESFDNLNGEIKEGVKDYTIAIKGGLNDMFKQYDESIANAFEKISSLTEQLTDSVEELNEFYENVMENSKGVSRNV